MAAAMTFVLSAGEIDLLTGGVVSLVNGLLTTVVGKRAGRSSRKPS